MMKLATNKMIICFDNDNIHNDVWTKMEIPNICFFKPCKIDHHIIHSLNG